MNTTPRMMRTAVMVVGITLLSFTGSVMGQDWPIGTFYYEITRKNVHTGMHTIASKRQGEDVVVETEEWLEDTGYCHASKRTEVWRSGTLLTFESSTAGSCSGFVRLFRPSACPWDEFGDPLTVSVVRKGKILLKQVGQEKSQEISGEVLPVNFMNPALRGPDHVAQVMDPITGELESMMISHKGVEKLSIGGSSTDTERYLVQVPDGQDRHLWYDPRGVWVKMFLQRDAVTFAAADPATMKSAVTSFVGKSGCLRTLPKLAVPSSRRPR
jgi:hypothetical protein